MGSVSDRRGPHRILPWSPSRAARRDSGQHQRLPLVLGGQGRTSRSLREIGDALLIAATWALIVLLAAAAIWSALYVASLVARRAS